jgi:hypothetical protein
MAIGATSVFELRTSGNALNGAGYDAGIASAGTDYTQQDAAQLAVTDLACSAGSTTVTSVTGGFTAAMIGNAINISSGTGFTAGFYFITAVADTNTATVDRTPSAGGGSVGVARVGGAMTLPTNPFAASLVPGNIVWIKSGSYTLAAEHTAVNGTTDLAVTWLGYKTTRGDAPTLTDRPAFTCGANRFLVGTRNIIENISFTGTASGGALSLPNSANGRLVNCKFTNTSGTADRPAVGGGQTSIFVACDFVSTAGNGTSGTITGAIYLGCYFHDSVKGVSSTSSNGAFINCVFDTCSTAGIELATSGTMVNCTVYNCGIGINLLATSNHHIANCILRSNTTGISATALLATPHLIGNIHSSTTNFSNVTVGTTDILADPLLNDPANGDFTLQTGSPAIGAGAQLSSTVGVTGTYNWNVGAAQSAAGAAAGGEASSTWVSG